MARIKQGIAGGFSGKIGPVIGYRLRNTDVIRALPKKSTKKPSVKQLVHRERFKIIQEWRSRLTDFFAITFKNQTADRSAQNAAHRFNSHIVTGEYPNLSIDPALIVISKGELPLPKELAMVHEGNTLRFSWNETGESKARNIDLAKVLIAYHPKNLYQSELTAAYRQHKGCNIELNYPPSCQFADVYFTMLSNDRERAADSVYMGRIEL